MLRRRDFRPLPYPLKTKISLSAASQKAVFSRITFKAVHQFCLFNSPNHQCRPASPVRRANRYFLNEKTAALVAYKRLLNARQIRRGRHYRLWVGVPLNELV